LVRRFDSVRGCFLFTRLRAVFLFGVDSVYGEEDTTALTLQYTRGTRPWTPSCCVVVTAADHGISPTVANYYSCH